MIKIKVIGRLGLNNYEVSLEDYFNAYKFLNAISVINNDDIYAPDNISIETEYNVAGKPYRVGDNSYCINMKNGKSAYLYQAIDTYYEPDYNEYGAKFTIVTEPYIEKVNVPSIGKFYRIFVNVQSNKTKNVYRVLFNENNIEEHEYNHIIEDWWKHLGSYDRQVALQMHDVMDVQEVFKVTDDIWDGLSFKVKREIYENSLSEE